MLFLRAGFFLFVFSADKLGQSLINSQLSLIKKISSMDWSMSENGVFEDRDLCC